MIMLIDFCDFYLTTSETANVAAPEACLCEWISTEDPAFESDMEIVNFRDQYCQVIQQTGLDSNINALRCTKKRTK